MDDGRKYRIIKDVMGEMRDILAKETEEYLASEDPRRKMKAVGWAGAAGILGAFVKVMDELDDGTLEAETVHRRIMEAFEKPDEPIQA